MGWSKEINTRWFALDGRYLEHLAMANFVLFYPTLHTVPYLIA